MTERSYLSNNTTTTTIAKTTRTSTSTLVVHRDHDVTGGLL